LGRESNTKNANPPKADKYQISNNECRKSKEGILSILFEDRAQRFHPSIFDSAESFDPESFGLELATEGLTTEGLVAGCGSLFKSNSVIETVDSSLIHK
jgi:hypothetical protein